MKGQNSAHITMMVQPLIKVQLHRSVNIFDWIPVAGDVPGQVLVI